MGNFITFNSSIRGDNYTPTTLPYTITEGETITIINVSSTFPGYNLSNSSTDYFIIGGIVLMNFSLNHLLNVVKNNINLLYIMAKPEELLKPRVIITFIFPNGKVNILNNITSDSFLEKINDIEIKQISEIKHALSKPILINGKKYIKLENDNGKYVILSIEEIIKEDLLFSNIYKYPLNNNFHKKYI